MSVVAHLVGPDTLGTNERGMVIKDNDGDYCLVTGVWTGVQEGKKGIPGTRNRRGVPGTPRNHGYCQIYYTNLRDPKERFSFEFRPSFTSITLKGLQLDLKSGKIRILKDEPDILQNICLAFSISVLYLMVQPRPEDTEAAADSFQFALDQARSARARGKMFPIPQTPPFLENDRKVIFQYCGWKQREKIPSNSTIAIFRKKNQYYPYYAGVYWGYGGGDGSDGAYNNGSFDPWGGRGDFAGYGGCGADGGGCGGGG